MKVECRFVCPGLAFETSTGVVVRPIAGEVYDVPDPVASTLAKRGFVRYEEPEASTDWTESLGPAERLYEDDGELD